MTRSMQNVFNQSYQALVHYGQSDPAFAGGFTHCLEHIAPARPGIILIVNHAAGHTKAALFTRRW